MTTNHPAHGPVSMRKRHSTGAKVFLAIYAVTFIVIVVSLVEVL
ncbi:adenylate cyclase-like protein-domain type III secretion membrane protein [Citrobacter phage vB_CfrS_K1M]